jgi:hypothetical protein
MSRPQPQALSEAEIMARPPNPVRSTGIIDAQRIRDGAPVPRKLMASLEHDGSPLPFLILFSDWSERQGDWRRRDLYQIEEIPAGIDGRAFLLHRAPAAIARDGPHADSRYGVFVHRNGQDQLCECKGFARYGRCKHVDALRRLIEDGHL